jgi:hypothetical protein
MSDDAIAGPKPQKRRGRPPKKRHDPADAPVNGNYTDDHVFNKDPDFAYFWASDEDIDKVLNRGGVVCKRDSEQARPFFDRRKDAGEADIVVKNLTLMKVPRALQEAHEKRDLSEAARRLAAMRREGTRQLGNGNLASISEHDGGYSRSIQ